MKFSRVKSISPAGVERVFDISMKSPHNSFVANGIVVHNCEELGFIKFDLLGIRHLDTLEKSAEMIKDRHGVELDFYEFGDKEYTDPAIWPQIDQGQTLGIFQLEASSMSAVAKQFKPRSETEVADLISVNRPGVVRAGLLKPYLDRRAGVEEPQFDHPLMREIVGRTYGIIVFQEQVLKTVQILAGFTPDEADGVRKILGKMLYEEMQKLQPKFIDGCLANQEFMDGVNGDREEAKKAALRIWLSIQESGVYVFNEAHAIGYALIAAWEVWVKHYYYPEFATALLQTDPEKAPKYIRELRSRGLKVLPPDVNESGHSFVLTPDDNIRYGLEAIKGVGATAVKEIISKRPYSSFEEFLDKVAARTVNKRVMDNLIKIGAFDCWGTREEVWNQYYTHRKEKNFETPKFNALTIADIEIELVGSFIMNDPMSTYQTALERMCMRTPDELDELQYEQIGTVGGQITQVKRHTTKRGSSMAFITITWEDAEFSVTVFPEAWSKYEPLIRVNAPVVTRVSKLEEGCHLVALERLDFLE